MWKVVLNDSGLTYRIRNMDTISVTHKGESGRTVFFRNRAAAQKVADKLNKS